MVSEEESRFLGNGFFLILGFISIFIGKMLIYKGMSFFRQMTLIGMSVYTLNYFWDQLPASWMSIPIILAIILIVSKWLYKSFIVNIVFALMRSFVYGLTAMTLFSTIFHGLSSIIPWKSFKFFGDHSGGIPTISSPIFLKLSVLDQLVPADLPLHDWILANPSIEIVFNVCLYYFIGYLCLRFGQKHSIISSVFIGLTAMSLAILWKFPETSEMIQDALPMDQLAVSIPVNLESVHWTRVSLHTYISLLGWFVGIFNGSIFAKNLVEMGLACLCGCIFVAVGILTVISVFIFDEKSQIHSFKLNLSAWSKLDSFILIIGLTILVSGIFRRYYIPSNHRLKAIGKAHARQEWHRRLHKYQMGSSDSANKKMKRLRQKGFTNNFKGVKGNSKMRNHPPNQNTADSKHS